MYLIFDTETTGLPKKWNAPISDSENWPRCVQLAWQLHDNNGKLISNQSSIIKSKDYIVKKFNELSKEYLNKEISRPNNWGGYIIKPIQYEFWQGGENRLHDRIRYTLHNNIWQIDRLSP